MECTPKFDFAKFSEIFSFPYIKSLFLVYEILV